MGFNSGSGASLLVAAFLASGCGGMEDEELAALKTRAAFDFQCSKGDIKTVTIDDDTKGVTGCGQRATYVRVCKDSWGCNWVLNGDSKRQRSEDEE